MDDLLSSLCQALTDLERRAEYLDDLLVPQMSFAAEATGGSSAPPGSKPPIVVGIVDLKIEVEGVLATWCSAVVRFAPEAGLQISHDLGIDERCRRLFECANSLVELPFFDRMVEEIMGISSLVREVIDVPGISPWSREIPEVGTAREIVRWVKASGMELSRWRLQKWISEGLVPSEVLPDRRVIVRFNDVVEQVRRSYFRDQPPPVVS
ncbi:hypothetical protein SFC07_11105 [Corynebacterium callunae]|uniref:hypothetical protein n=1 Tax=Corynebacterium callunae TaxID=1721 RepID=UPI0039823804